MQLSPARKLGLGLLGALLLALTGSGLAYLSAGWSVERLEALLQMNLEQSRMVYDLQMGLLEEKFRTISSLIDDVSRWRDVLEDRTLISERWLERLGQSGIDPERKEAFLEIGRACREYDAVFDHAKELFEARSAEEALLTLRERVRVQYGEVSRLCEEVMVALETDTEKIVRLQEVRMQQVGVWMGVCLGLLVLLMGGLYWMMWTGFFGPLHGMAEDARRYAEQTEMVLPQAEIEAVEQYLETLRTDVEDAQNRLARSNRRLLDAEQMASIGRIAAGVAHEIRSPLTSLRLRSFSMKKTLGQQYAADFEVITEEVSRLDSIIHNFLEFSRPPDLRLQPCRISLVLEKTLELLRFKLDLLHIEVDYQDPGTISSVQADSHQLRQVFLNLLNNALEVLSDGGRIVIRAVEKAKGGRPVVVVTLKDTGPGMPAGAMERVFDPFFSTKEDGAGLGLWIAQRIMAQHGGALELVSSTEHGTTFAVTIPVAGEVTDEHNPGR